MDGGDCCESTCVSTSQYICGAEEEGYVSTGYFSCRLPSDVWQNDPLNGEAGSYSGFDLDLSLRSVAVAELLLDRVRVYDKVGSSWVLRDTIVGQPGTRFGTAIALSSGAYNVVSNPSFLAPLTLAIIDGYRTLRIYKCNIDGCAQTQEIALVYEFDLSDDGTVLVTSLFKVNREPPNQVRVYETIDGLFQHRADLNITKNNTLLDIYSMSLSGDGGMLALQNQLSVNGISTHDYFDLLVWNGASYEFESEFQFFGDFNAHAYSLSLSLSQDGSVLAYGIPDCSFFQLHVYRRDDDNSWAAMAPPPLSTAGCIDSDRPKRNNNLALSMDGSMLAFRLGIDVEVFQWKSEGWRTVGGGLPLIKYPVAISSDGKELAIGSPEEGIGGITTVYSLPGTKECPSGKALLRVSLTLDGQPEYLHWHLQDNKTGEFLYREGPYPKDYAFGTIVEESCVDVDACHVFTFYDAQNRGLQAPGQYALLLDGEDVGRGTFDGLYERVFFGQGCEQCPEGTERFSLMVLTCGPVYWGMVQLVDQGNSTLPIQSGNTSQSFTDGTVYSSCDFDGEHQGKICNNPVEMYYDTCLNPEECYAVKVVSQNKAISYLELDMGGIRTKGNEIAVCAGSSVFAGT